MIRRAVPDDAPRIAQVHLDTWLTTYRGLIPDSYLDGLGLASYLPRWQQRLLEGKDLVLVAEVDGQVVGFAHGGPERSGEFATLSAEIYALYVLQGFHGQGIGRALVLAAARKLAAQHTGMLIWVLQGNPAEHFYQAIGGSYVAKKPLVIGGAALIEIGYGWDDLRTLIPALAEPRST